MTPPEVFDPSAFDPDEGAHEDIAEDLEHEVEDPSLENSDALLELPEGSGETVLSDENESDEADSAAGAVSLHAEELTPSQDEIDAEYEKLRGESAADTAGEQAEPAPREAGEAMSDAETKAAKAERVEELGKKMADDQADVQLAKDSLNY